MVTRRLWCDAEAGAYAREALNFPGLQVLARVDSEQRQGGAVVSQETRYFAFSGDPSRVTPEQLLAKVRGHWQVENSLHFIKDRWWDEDRHYCSRPGLARGLVVLLNAALSLLRAAPVFEDGLPIRARADALNDDMPLALSLLTHAFS